MRTPLHNLPLILTLSPGAILNLPTNSFCPLNTAAFVQSFVIATEEEEVNIKIDFNKLLIEENLHLVKSGAFYKLKTKYKRKARKTLDMEVIALDFHTPNITTNDVY